MSYTDAQLDALVARVNALDGQGLAAGLVGSVPAVQAKVNGVAADQKQLINALQQKLNTVLSQVTALLATSRSIVGLSPA
jgi:hypothetical protein